MLHDLVCVCKPYVLESLGRDFGRLFLKLKMVLKRLFSLILMALLGFGMTVGAQDPSKTVRSQEVNEQDGVPVLIKHLPDVGNAQAEAVFARNVGDLRNALGDRPVLDLVELTGGTEAVVASYDQGKLLLIEYTNPQASLDADARFRERLAGASVVYRRIGNYSAFVFDAPDPVAANALLDQIKYQKTVQWLGEDPYLLQRVQRYFAMTTRDIFISTVIWIVMGFGIAIITGIISGYFFFRTREQKRADRTAFSDAGGLTRLNLDDLSEPL